MKRITCKPIFDWGDFASLALLPTVLVGGGRNWNSRYGWCYLFWLQGRMGFSWNKPDVKTK